MTLGQVFAEPEVARAYRHRPPYPPETFTILERLLVGPRTILDAGAGSGALARKMVGFAVRVDAVDPSVAMVDDGRRLPGGDDRRLRWIVGTAEDAPLDPPYGLVTAGASLHWMDADRAMPRFAAALATGGRLAIVDTENVAPWRQEIVEVFKRYDEVAHHQELPDLVATLEERGRFRPEAELRTAPMPWRWSVDEYLEWLHSTSTLARSRLGDRAAPFDDEIRAFFARRAISEVAVDVVGTIVWGRPR